MKNLLYILLFLSSCSIDKYKGYVYDVNQKPLKDVTVSNLSNREKVQTNSIGYFELNKVKNSSGKLVFEKKGFCTDTIWSVEIQNGEKQKERFKGEIIHLLKKEYRDSILKLNGVIK